ncbi:hypothetical protein EKO04_005671 [Ascochyta lentis]|uniref:Uncharacterized protein n=1 Tax=Ascochyta lentis TaxID=205686 RepID=A0A8H7J4V6_9PLEO|nr:hypothetical protein EKO04_005671 [Ascochyta lentis]
MEHELLQLHSKLFDKLHKAARWHNMAIEFSPLSCLKDTNNIMVGMPCSRIIRDLDRLTGAKWIAIHQVELGDLAVLPGFSIDPAFEDLIIRLFDSLLAFTLYLTTTGTEICGFQTENNLHHLMFDTFVEHLAGRGRRYECNPIVNGQPVTPRGANPTWGVYTRPETRHWPPLLKYECRF